MSKCAQAFDATTNFAQEQSRRDRAGEAAAAGIVEIGDRALEHRLVGPPQRHAPQRIGDARCGGRDLRRERLVVGVIGRQIGAERDPRRAGQRREVEEELRRLLVGERERVGENEPPFGVGVADFDGEALAAAQDVAGAHRRGGDRVLDDRDQHAQADVEASSP